MAPVFQLALSFLALVTSSTFAAALPGVVESDIVGGTQAPAGSFKFIVALILNGVQDCNGVLVNANTVLTVGHCGFDNNSPSSWRVRAGSQAWDDGSIEVAVASFLFHPGYNDVTLDNDISLWRLSTPIYQSPTISYVNLPPQNFDPPVGANIVAAGWGPTYYAVHYDTKYLRELTYPVVSRATCQAKAVNFRVTNNMFCAGTPEGVRNACYGDSGGPAVGAGSDTLWGLISWRDKRDCSGPGDPYDGYLRVGEYVDWINQHKF